MKRIIQTLALLLCLQAAKADNLEWLVKLTIEQKDGTKTFGYITFVEGAISKDSIKNFPYLIKIFDRLDTRGLDNILSIYSTMLEYKYKSLCDKINTSDVLFINEVSVPTKLIKKITVHSVSEHSNFTAIINNLTNADTAWIRTKPVKTTSAKGDMCLFELYFHEYNGELAKLVAQLKAQSKKGEEDGSYSKMDAIIKKIIRFKVVVIQNWTC